MGKIDGFDKNLSYLQAEIGQFKIQHNSILWAFVIHSEKWRQGQ